MMTKRKMPAVLLAGLMILALAGCGADKTENTGSDPASAESGITATATDNASEPTDESSLPADSESKSDESTAEKEQAEGNAPADSGTAAETRKPAESADKAETVPPTQAPKQSEPPKGFTEADHTRIVFEVKAYAESYNSKGFTFEWAEELAFGWDVGWMGTPRISRDGVDGVISTLKHHVDLIYKTGTDPANGVTANSVRYKVVQLEIDGGIAYAVIYG